MRRSDINKAKRQETIIRMIDPESFEPNILFVEGNRISRWRMVEFDVKIEEDEEV